MSENKFFSERKVEEGFKKGFKGNWGAEAHTKRIGLVQDLNRLSFFWYMTLLRKTNLPIAADGAKIALYNLMDAGFELVGFVHDEIITEVPENTAEEMRGLQEEIMVNSMSLVVPDVKISVESTISPRYCK